MQLGRLFEAGQGVELAPAQAADWYRKAVDRGYAPAQLALAKLILDGKLADQSPEQAVPLLQKAARSNHEAEYRLGLLYRDGIGVEQDANQAETWFRKAAVGIPEAKAALEALPGDRPKPDNPQQTLAPPVPPDQQAEFDYAVGLQRQGSYAAAESTLKSFLSRHYSGPLIGSANFWLGEAQAARNRFKDAVTSYSVGLRSDPRGPKAAETLLRLGQTYASLNDRDNACQTLGRLAAEFPDMPDAVRHRSDEQRLRLTCP